MKKIDILMATFNGEKYLREQIDSILGQTYKNFNLIISDDASTDSTLEILREYELMDKRVKVFSQKENLGVIANFEFLLNQVDNEFFMLADQDDIWDVDKVEISYDKLEADEADLVYSDLKVVDSKLNVIADSYWKIKGFSKKVYKYNNFESLYLNNYITGCTILCKSKWISKILPLPKTSEFVIHDYWISLVVSMNGRMTYVSNALTKYRQHKSNQIGSKRRVDSLNSFDEIRDLFIRVKKEHFEIFIQKNSLFSPKYKELNEKSLKYFKMLEKKKYINFKNWILFFKLYKYEKYGYKIKNFVILNIPFLGRLLMKLKGSKNGK